MGSVLFINIHSCSNNIIISHLKEFLFSLGAMNTSAQDSVISPSISPTRNFPRCSHSSICHTKDEVYNIYFGPNANRINEVPSYDHHWYIKKFHL